MNKITEILDGVKTMAIAGHIRPDGDCVGSCMALYLYIKEWYPQIQTDLYMEDPSSVFDYIPHIEEHNNTVGQKKDYDLFVSCDASSRDRIGVAGSCFENARKTLCIDHHISNVGFADVNYVKSDVSSASEVLYGLLEEDKITQPVAMALYTGIVHDTGVFQYSSTKPETMRVAARLMETGFDFSRIIEESFYQKTYTQNQIMGRVLAESILLQDGRCIAGYLRKKDMDFYGAQPKDLDGIVSQLRLTAGTEVAMFLYELETQKFKVSLRSNGKVDVNSIAVYFGGGGHVKAAGCEMSGSMYDVINNITAEIEKQL